MTDPAPRPPLLSRIPWLWILALSPIFFVTGMWLRGQLSEQVETQSDQEVSLVKEQLEDWQSEHKKLQAKHEELQKSYDNITLDRNNVLQQTKRLIGENNELREIKNQYNKLKQQSRSQTSQLQKLGADLQELSKKYDLISQTLSKVQAERNQFEGNLASVTRERDRYKGDWEEETHRLQEEMKHLERENKGLEKQAKKRKDYEGKYKEAVEIVKVLEEETKDLKDDLKKAPGRFKDMAHENKTLTRETAQMHYNLGVFYAEQNKFDRAIPEFERAVSLDPREYRAHYNLGYIYSEHFQEHEKAAEHFREYLRLEPQDEGSDWVRSYLLAQETFDGGVLKG